jgi:hypothetical protein
MTNSPAIDELLPQYDTQVAALTDDGPTLYVYLLGDNGDLYALVYANGQWGGVDLNEVLPRAPKPVQGSPLAAVTVPGDAPCVYYLGSEDPGLQLIEIQWAPGASPSMTDVTAETASALNGSAIAAVTGPGGNRQVYATLEGGDLYSFSWVAGAFVPLDLTTQISSPQPAAGGAIAAATSARGYPLVSYRAGDGDLYLLLWDGAKWDPPIDLNTEVNSSERPMASTSIALLDGVQPVPHVYYIGGTGDLYEFTYARDEWINSNLTTDANAPQPVAPTAVAGSEIVAVTVEDDTIRVYFSGVDGDIHELASSGHGDEWKDTDVTADAGAEKPQGPPPGRKPVPCTALAATTTEGGDPRVYFIGLDGHFYDLELGWSGKLLL